MRLPNLLATRRGRLLAFFLLYVTEGIPLGFAATAVATQLRRQNVGPAAIGAFVATFYLPWAFKWAVGPIVDVIAWKRLGRRRGWILITQLLMSATLLSTVVLRLPDQLWLFTVILLVHNTFGATQDVAIDALACTTLSDDERGVANGIMFGGSYVGQMLGGSGALFVASYAGFGSTYFFVTGCILAVTVFVVLPMREAPSDVPNGAEEGSRLRAAGRQMHAFALEAFRSFLGSRGAFAGVFFALLPAGAMSLALSLQSNLAVELGLSDDQIGWLNLWSAVIAASACVFGGLLSDRFGRKRILAVFCVLTSVPVLFLMSKLSAVGWVMPVDVSAPDRPVPPHAVIIAFWLATLVFSLFTGLGYGARMAIFMDVTNKAVAATQFTAYMALSNLAISFSATWQGIAIERLGYPKTLMLDAGVGLLCLAVLPLMRKQQEGAPITDHHAPKRARIVALTLGLLCLAWAPCALWWSAIGAFQPIASTLFTLVFVAAPLFLLAGAAMLRSTSRSVSWMALATAPLLLLMHLRSHVDAIADRVAGAVDPAAFVSMAQACLFALPCIAGVVLMVLAAQRWQPLAGE